MAAIANPVPHRATPGRTILRDQTIAADRHLLRAVGAIPADRRILLAALVTPADPPRRVGPVTRVDRPDQATRSDLHRVEVTRAAIPAADIPGAATQEDQVLPVRVPRVRIPADRVRLARQARAAVRAAEAVVIVRIKQKQFRPNNQPTLMCAPSRKREDAHLFITERM